MYSGHPSTAYAISQPAPSEQRQRRHVIQQIIHNNGNGKFMFSSGGGNFQPQTGSSAIALQSTL